MEKSRYADLVLNYVTRLKPRHFKDNTQTPEEMTCDFMKVFEAEGHREAFEDSPLSDKKYVMIRVKQELICSRKGREEAFIGELLRDDLKVIKLLKQFVNTLQVHFHPHMRTTRYDLVMDCYLKWQMNGYLKKFNGKITSPHYFLKIGVRNFLIDCERSANRKIKTVSADTPVGDGSTIMDVVDQGIIHDYAGEVTIKELLVSLDQLPSWGPTVLSPLVGATQLSHHTVVQHALAGFNLKDTAVLFNISDSRVKKIRAEAISHMRSQIKI